MITFLVGENTFERRRFVRQLADGFEGEVQRVDGEGLLLGDLPDLLMGASLFSSKRLVIISNLSENKPVWEVLVQWLERTNEDLHLVLVEAKPDKRTKTYKELAKRAEVHEFQPWTERDRPKVAAWVTKEAAGLGLAMDIHAARRLVEQVGVDQWQLFHAIEKLALVGDGSVAAIEYFIDATLSENIFVVLDTALRGDVVQLRQILEVLETSEDPYQLFGLLSSQVFQLGVVVTAAVPASVVAKDFGIHPFVLSKLEPHAKTLGRAQVRKVVEAFTDADKAMKTSSAEPWVLIERALVKVSDLI